MEEWNNMSHIIRRKDMIQQFTSIIPPDDYIVSTNTNFTFNESILNQILKEMINNIPDMKQTLLNWACFSKRRNGLGLPMENTLK